MTTVIADTAASAPAAVETPQTSQPAPEMTAEQSAKFWETGELPKAPASAPGKDKDKKEPPTKQDSAPAKDAADTSSASASDKEQKSHRKDKEDTERRFKELSESHGKLQRENEDLRRQLSGPRDKDKPASQAAPEEIKAPPPFKQFMSEFFAKAENKDKKYEDGFESYEALKDKYLDAKHKKELAESETRGEQRARQQAAAKELQTKVEEGKKRYSDFDDKVWPSMHAIMEDQQVPLAIKAMLNRSDVLVDLVYALGKDNVETFIALSKSDPGAALEKLVELQADVRKALKSSKQEAPKSSETSSEKNPTSEPKPAPPKPPAEVGGRGTVDESPDKAAARSGNFRAFEESQWAKHKRA